MQREEEYLKALLEMEDLASKKAGVYAKLLLNVSFAEEMQKLASLHTERKGALLELLYGKREGGMSAMNGGKTEK